MDQFASIREFNFLQAIFVYKKRVSYGNARLISTIQVPSQKMSVDAGENLNQVKAYTERYLKRKEHASLGIPLVADAPQ